MNITHIQLPAHYYRIVRDVYLCDDTFMEPKVLTDVPSPFLQLMIHADDSNFQYKKDRRFIEAPRSYACGINSAPATLRMEGRCRFLCIVFQPWVTGCLFGQEFITTKSIISIENLFPQFIHHVADALSPNDISGTTLRNIVIAFVDELAQMLSNRDAELGKKMDVIKTCTDYILNNPVGSADQLLKKNNVGVSYRTLTRIFRAYTGTSMGTFMRTIKVLHALDILRCMDGESVVEILHKCGYESQSHLTAITKQWTGITPGLIHKKLPLLIEGTLDHVYKYQG